MPRKTTTTDTTAVEEQQPALERKSNVEVLPDGRVRATVTGLKEEIDELTYACSQGLAAKTILNDVAPEIK